MVVKTVAEVPLHINIFPVKSLVSHQHGMTHYVELKFFFQFVPIAEGVSIL
jgi:hypothetical protein